MKISSHTGRRAEAREPYQALVVYTAQGTQAAYVAGGGIGEPAIAEDACRLTVIEDCTETSDAQRVLE